jgi:hypothetical protein
MEARAPLIFIEHTALFTHAEQDEADLAPLSEQQVAQQDGERPGGLWISDVWKDPLCLSYLQDGEFSQEQIESVSAKERHRIVKRSTAYQFIEDETTRVKTLFRLFVGNLTGHTKKQVPRPEERSELVKRTHEMSGHFGRRRTYHLLSLSYWWAGMDEAVRQCVRSCHACSQMNASFNSTEPTLKPLPIMGMFWMTMT